MNLVPYAVPVFLLLIVAEIFWGLWRKNNTYRVNDAINSLTLGTLSTATKLYALAMGATIFATVEQDWALWQLDVNSLWAWLIGLLIYDFLYYWFHRISHERQIFWASHVVHHQSEDYNLSTALRQTSTGFVLTWIFFVPCFLLGMPLYMYVGIASGHLIYQFWIHTQHIPRLGWLEWFLVTPYNHRIHHAQNSCYIDKNYGGLLILWDRMFGTYAAEQEGEEIIYGISTPLASWNPLWANVHVFSQMLTDACRTKSWRAKFTIWASRTGWRPADVAAAYPETKSDLQNFSKYDPGLGRWAVAALCANFFLIAVVDIWFQGQAMAVPYVVRVGYVSLLFYTLIVLGLAMEGNPTTWLAEAVRWLLTLGVLSAGYYLDELVSQQQWLVGAAYLVASAVLMVVVMNTRQGQNEATAVAAPA